MEHCGGKEKSYLVTLLDSNGMQQIIVQSPCVCDLQEWVTDNQVMFGMTDPEVISVDEREARHIPIVEPS